MRKLFCVLVILLNVCWVNNALAQNTNPNYGIFFQAVARDNFSNPAKDRILFVESSILQFTANGTKVLTELHQTTTDGLGVFSINIGSGQRIGGTLSGLDKVDWANGPYYLGLKIAIKPFSPVSNWDYTKELIDLGASSFGTVPYAYYAGSTANVKDVIKATDTASMLLPYAKASALQQINTNLSLKVNVADSTTIYVTPTQLKAVKFDTSLIYNLLSEKEILTNKSVNVNADSTSNTKYPSVRAVKSYVDLQFSNFVLPDGSVSTAKLANGAVTNEKIISVAGSKITGDIAGNAATATKLAAPKNINGLPFDGSADITIAADAATLSGTVVVAKGGTGATTAADARTNLGLVIGTNVLAQRSFGTAANSAATDFVAATEKGANNGVATLGVNGKIPSVQIPAISFQSVSVVNSDATMTAISGAQVGSIAIRSDLNINYVLSALPATTLSNWIQLAASTDVSTINGIVGPSVNLTTNEIPEGNTNKYYTDARVRGAVSAVAPLNFNASSGVLSMTTASTTSAGFLTASDFNTFNNKQATLTAGVDYATPAGNITGNAANVTGIVSIANGGTGTSTATGALVALGAEPSDNKSDNILVDGASTTKFPTFRAIKSYVDQQSQNAGVADNSITSAKINGTLAVLKGGTGASNPADARTNLGLVIGTDVMAANATTTLTGDVTGAGNGSFATTLANSGVTSGTYGSSTAIPTLTVDSKGRITSASTVGIIAGVNSLNYTSTSSYAAGGTISGTTLTLAAADGTNPGLVSTGAQTIAGAKTFSNTTTFNTDISVNGYRIGKGAANVGSNVALGFLAMNNASSSGINNVSIGSNTLSSLSTGNNNIAIGANALTNVTTGGNNIAIGKDALTNLPTSGTSNTAIGTLALTAATSSNNTAIGNGAGTRVTSGESNVIVGSTTGIYLTTGSNNLMLGNLAGSGTGTGGVNNVTGTNSVFIGRSAQPQNDGQANQVVIAGYDGTNANTGLGSNTTLIGNTATTQTQIMGALKLPNTTSSTSTTTGALVVAGGAGIAGATNIGGNVTASSFIKSGGTSSQFLKADGSVDANSYLTGNQTITLTGDVTASGTGTFTSTLANSGVTSGTYGSSTAIPTLTVDSKGRITSASTVGIIAGVNSLNYTTTSSYAAGGTISGTSLTLTAADGTNPGLLSTSAQTIAGAKTFSNDLTAPNFIGNVTGTVTGNLSGTANTATNLAGGVSGSIPYQTASGTTAMIPVGSANQFLTSVAGGTYTWTSSSAVTGNFVPYTGASGAVDLGAYDLTVNGLTIGRGNGAIATNTALGAGTLSSTTTGIANTAVGVSALGKATSPNSNTAVGAYALRDVTTGGSNTAMGSYAALRITTGTQNVAIGHSTLNNVTTNSNNTAVGYASIGDNFGVSNTALGAFSLQGSAASGGDNTAIGKDALKGVVGTSKNTALGSGSLLNLTTGDANIALGFNAGALWGSGAGTNLTNLRQGIIIGNGARPLFNNSLNEVVIGFGVVGNGSNTVTIGTLSNTANYFTGDINLTGNVNGGTWSGTAIGSNYGGAGTLNGLLKANGSGVVSAAVAGTDFMAANATTSLTGDVTGSGSGTFTTTLSTSGVTAGSYGSSTAIPTFTVDAKGRLTAASTVGIVAGVNSLNYTSTTSYTAGGTISGTSLTLAAADATNPGLVSTGAQTIAGVKTFSADVTAPNFIGNLSGNATTATTATTAGNITATSNTTLTSLANLATVGTITSGVWSGTAIANDKLANSALTIGSTNIALGATSSTLSGLSTVTSTNFTGALTGNASTATTATNLAGGVSGSIPYQTAAGTTAMIPVGSANQFLTSVAGGTYTWTSTSAVTGNFVPYTGASGAVNLGAYDLTVNGLTVGEGGGSDVSNTAVGNKALFNNVIGGVAPHHGTNNAAFGYQSMMFNTNGFSNTSVGGTALKANTTGSWNTAMGYGALTAISAGFENTGIGMGSLDNLTTGSNNIAIGSQAGRNSSAGSLTTSNQSIFIGSTTRPKANSSSNEIVIGHVATGNGNNTVTIGNAAIGANYFSGSINLTGNVNGGTWSGTTIGSNYGGAGAVNGILKANGSGVVSAAVAGTDYMAANATTSLTGDVTGSGSGTFTTTLSTSGVTAGSYGSTTAIPTFTVDAKGRLTAASTVSIVAGVNTVTAIAGTSNANGATISGTALTLTPADATNGGVITTGTQEFAGSKTFSNDIYIKSTSGSVRAGSGNGSLQYNTAFGMSSLQSATANNNSGFGYFTLRSNTTGINNAAFGSWALAFNTTGSNNVAMGNQALGDKATYSRNVAIGASALRYVTGDDNVAVGNEAGLNLGTTGTAGTALKNIIIGSYAGTKVGSANVDNTTGRNSVLIGYDVRPAANDETNQIIISGYNGTAGTVGLGSNTTLIGNSATTNTRIMGALDLPSTTASTSSSTGALTVGGGAGIAGALNVGGTTTLTGAATISNTTTSTNTTTGALVVRGGVGIAGNVTIGGTLEIEGGSPGVGKVLTSDANGLASWNTPTWASTVGTITTTAYANGGTISGTTLTLAAAGTTGPGLVTTGTQTFAGAKTFSNTTTFNSDIAVNGINAGLGSGNIATNTAFGSSALNVNTTGKYNTAIGYNTLMSNLTTDQNTAVGYEALKNTTAANNTAVGTSVLTSNTTGTLNSALGNLAMFMNTTGANNTAFGGMALRNNVSGSDNTALGHKAGTVATGSQNIFLGSNAGLSNTSVSNNILIGFGAGQYYGTLSNTNYTTGGGNVLIGTDVRPLADGQTNQVVIAGYTGSGVGMTGNGSNTVTIGNTSNTANYLRGVTNLAAGTMLNTSGVNLTGSIDDFFQYNVQNTSTGTKAQSGYAATANNGNDVAGFAWMGINNSNFNFPTAYNIGAANDVTYIGSGQDMHIANANNSKSIVFSTGTSTTPFFNEKMRLTNSGTLAIGTTGATAVDTVNAKLHVAGKVRIVDGAQAAGRVLTSDANGVATWQNSGGSVITMSATGNATATASYIIFTGSTAGVTITIPSAVTLGAGRELTIKNVASVSVTIASAGGNLIQDNSTLSATTAALGIEPSNNWMKLVSDGTHWYIFRALF